ncbi:MAG: outer membrane protein assembly factor BamA [Phycisphaerales bacterium]
MLSTRARFARCLQVALAGLICLLLMEGLYTPAVHAQEAGTPDEAAFVDRLISAVEITGLNRVPERKVRNVLLTQAGDPYDPAAIAGDLEVLYRLGDFRTIDVRPRLMEDGTVVVTFALGEQPLLADVQVVGNRAISDQKLLGGIPLIRGVPRDDYLIEESITRIKSQYQDRGHYLAEVEVDNAALEETGVLIFRILEGPRVKVRSIKFFGNTAFSHDQLKRQLQTKTALFLFRKGRLDEQVIASDVASLESFYRDRGYQDVRVGRTIELSPDDREAKITFLIEEGAVFTMRSVTSVGSTVWSDDELAALAAIKSGDIYSQDRIRQSVEILNEAYGELGYYDARVVAIPLRIGDEPRVDLRFEITEGIFDTASDNRVMVGEVIIQDNTLTKDKVIRRHLPFSPGRPLSANDIREGERRLRATRLFADVDITVQPPLNPALPNLRDVLVEIDETNTGSLNFGVAAGSDAGLIGEVSLNQRNFDIADLPRSLDELVRGRAFRGGGQIFNAAIQPGNEVSRFSIGLTEPYFLDTPVAVSGSAFYRERQYSEYDEERSNGSLTVSRRLGDLWTIGLSTSYERIQLSDINPDSTTAVFAAAGPDVLTSVGMRLTRNTTGSRIRPGRGSVIELNVDRFGLLGGDYDFTKASAEHTTFFTISEDFLGRRSILRLNVRAQHIFEDNEAPLYEKFYLGGRQFRGFDFRTVSPRGIRNDNGEPSRDSVGGEWLFFAGVQYEFPIFEELFNGVVFIDSGTVTDSVGFDDYRVSVGFGARLYIDALGPVPVALDFAIPIRSEEQDEEQIFSFSAEVPF